MKPKFLSVDRNERWPVQGWTSGNNDYILDAESAEELAGRRVGSSHWIKSQSWPLQGWCKAPTAPKSNTGRSQDDDVTADHAKARAQSR
jgi:hypothetical protein